MSDEDMDQSVDRLTYIKNKIKENCAKLTTVTQRSYKLSNIKKSDISNDSDLVSNLLTRKQENAMGSMHCLDVYPIEKDHDSFHEESGSHYTKNGIHPVKLPKVSKLPPYTTWVFSCRNMMVTKDQHGLGLRRICYHGNYEEKLISNDQYVDNRDKLAKKEFKQSDDRVIWMTIEECGMSDSVLDTLALRLKMEACDIKTRYQMLHKRKTEGSLSKMGETNANVEEMCLDKDLDAALGSFDKLFCRQCLVFGCNLHGCFEDVIFPMEKQPPWSSVDNSSPCGDHCYKLASKLDVTTTTEDAKTILSLNKSSNRFLSNEKGNISLRRRGESQQSESSPASRISLEIVRKEQKKMPLIDYNLQRTSTMKGAPQMENNSTIIESQYNLREKTNKHSTIDGCDSSKTNAFLNEDIYKHEDTGKAWKVIEQGLLVKGLKIFGRNSCLIARNLLGGMKTCRETFEYMNSIRNNNASTTLSGVGYHVKGLEVNGLSMRSRFTRRRRRVGHNKYIWKSRSYYILRKKITETKDHDFQKYSPCSCQPACGKQCSCLRNGTYCEKYCGCPKVCKNRFPGCNCAKGQCRSRRCPCFAAARECDPDVCRNCRMRCGDGTLEIANHSDGNYECHNMKMLLNQHQRVLLGISDVEGWGAFLKNSVREDEFIGEYTGELMSHADAAENISPYQFNTDDKFVIDAMRVGNKLKFANHSSTNPNCYAKIIKVAGDHRVGIFAKRPISAGEELLYNYNYKPEVAPAWAKEEAQSSRGSRPKKRAH